MIRRATSSADPPVEVPPLPSLGSQFRSTAMFNGAVTATGAAAGILIARWLAPDGRGHYAGISTWLFFILVFGELGMSSALVYFVSRNPSQGDAYVRSAAKFLLCVSAPLTVAAMLAAPYLSQGRSDVLVGYLIAFAAIPIAFVGAAPSFALQSLSMKRWGIVRLAQPALFLSAISIAGTLTPLNLALVLILYACCLAIQSAIAWALYLTVRETPEAVERSVLRPLLSYGLPSLLASGPALMNGRVDQLVLSLAVPASDLGRYAVAVSLTSMATPVTQALGNVIFPRLAADPAVTDRTRDRIRRTLLLGYAVGLLVIVPLAVASHWLVPPLFGEAYAGTSILVAILAPGAVLLTTNAVMGDMLRGLGSPIVAARAELIGAALTVAALLVTIPRYGVVGAALTSTLVYVVVHGLLRRNLHKRLGAPAM